MKEFWDGLCKRSLLIGFAVGVITGFILFHKRKNRVFVMGNHNVVKVGARRMAGSSNGNGNNGYMVKKDKKKDKKKKNAKKHQAKTDVQ